jgi:hypothetical protein
MQALQRLQNKVFFEAGDPQLPTEAASRSCNPRKYDEYIVNYQNARGNNSQVVWPSCIGSSKFSAGA